MIYYIASYPRSGNSWLLRLIMNQFGRLTTPIHGKPRTGPVLQQWIQSRRGLKITRESSDPPGNTPTSAFLSDWYLFYETWLEPQKRHKVLWPGCENLLNDEEARARLAQEDEHFFVKTHLGPYAHYFPGEYVIQIIRNPGACLWSYYNFHPEVEQVHKPLSEVIKGNVNFGSWSTYHRDWLDAAEKLGECYLRVHYEGLFGRELSLCRRLEAFADLPILSTEFKTFKEAHAASPRQAREGKAAGWEQHYAQAQLHLLWQEHREVMSALGYEAPRYQDGLEEALY